MNGRSGNLATAHGQRQLDFLEPQPGGLATTTPGGAPRAGGVRYPPDIDQPTLDGQRWLEAVRAWCVQPGDAWPRVILHADLDCFFVSVERLANPALVGKPVVVGGSPDSRGVVCSASYEARAFGVRSAMPCSQAARLCPQAVFVPPSGAYGDYSRRVRAIFQRFAPLVQMVSLDEGYLDATGLERHHASPEALATALRRAVLEETGLPLSIGGGTTRLVAKVASGRAKPDGQRLVAPGEEADFLAPLPLKALPGFGGKLGETLRARGLERVEQVRELGLERLRKLFGGEEGSALFYRLHGFDPGGVTPGHAAKSVGAERTFDRDRTENAELTPLLTQLAGAIATRLRRMGARAATLTLKLRRPDFETITRAAALDPPSHEDFELVRLAHTLLEANHRDGEPLRLIGLTSSGLRYHAWQPDLVREQQTHSPASPDVRMPHALPDAALYAALDAVRRRHGADSVRLASTLGVAERPRATAEALSGRASTPG